MTVPIDQVLRLERRGWESLCRGNGAAVYGQLMTDDAVMVLAHGLVLDRAAVIASLDEAPTWDRYEIADQRLIQAGDACVILVYTGRAWRAEEPEFHALMSSVYRRLDGGWRLALYQQTVVPGEPGQPG